jgi:hypothetical protein
MRGPKPKKKRTDWTGFGRSPITAAGRLEVAASRPTAISATTKAQVAQLVEQRTENPRVGGSIPPLGTINYRSLVVLYETGCAVIV